MAASKKRAPRFGDTEAAARVREWIDQKGFDDAFIEGWAEAGEVKDARFHSLVRRYEAAYRALKKYVDSKLKHNDPSWHGDEFTVSHVAERYHQEGFDYAFESYSDFKEVQDRRFHTLRRGYLAARKALDKYLSESPTRQRRTFRVQAERLEAIQAKYKPKTFWQRLFGG